jgi:flagellar assembly factor FliW
MTAIADTPKVDPDKIITFPQGLTGFEDDHRFSLCHSDVPESKLFWLESLDHPDLTLTLIDPTVYGLNYAINLSDEEEALLQAKDPHQIIVFLVLAKNAAPDEKQPDPNQPLVHANIAGPILINTDKRIAMQKVLFRSQMELNIIDSAISH